MLRILDFFIPLKIYIFVCMHIWTGIIIFILIDWLTQVGLIWFGSDKSRICVGKSNEDSNLGRRFLFEKNLDRKVKRFVINCENLLRFFQQLVPLIHSYSLNLFFMCGFKGYPRVKKGRISERKRKKERKWNRKKVNVWDIWESTIFLVNLESIFFESLKLQPPQQPKCVYLNEYDRVGERIWEREKRDLWERKNEEKTFSWEKERWRLDNSCGKFLPVSLECHCRVKFILSFH